MAVQDRTTRRLVVLGAVSALVVGALAFPALADSLTEDPSETSTAEATEAPSREALPDLHPRAEGMRDGFVEALAEELDLPVETVTDAIEAAHERLAEQWRDERLADLREHLDESVAGGDLTQEQADAIIAAAEQGVLPFGPGLRHRHGFGGPPELGALPEMDGPLFQRGADEPEAGSEGA